MLTPSFRPFGVSLRICPSGGHFFIWCVFEHLPQWGPLFICPSVAIFICPGEGHFHFIIAPVGICPDLNHFFLSICLIRALFLGLAITPSPARLLMGLVLTSFHSVLLFDHFGFVADLCE